MKRRVVFWRLGDLVLCAGLGALAFRQAGNFLDTPSRPLEKADLSVALGGVV